MDKAKSAALLKKRYLADPCGVLPNAFRRTLDRLSALECSYVAEKKDTVELRALDEQGLYVYWNQSRTADTQTGNALGSFEFAIIHGDYVSGFDVGNFAK